MLSVLRDVVPLAGLVTLLVLAYRHVAGRWEALAGVAAAGLTLAIGALGWAGARREIDELLPVVIFLAAILVVSEACRSAGLFAAIGDRMARLPSPRAMLLLGFVVAAVTTAVLSLDATVVLVTPVAVAAATRARVSSRPLELLCVRLANSASLLLPVSNLTNLLALPSLGISFTRFFVLMAPVWIVVLALEYAGHRYRFRHELAEAARPASGEEPRPIPRFPLIVVALMLAGFAVGSAFGVQPAWIAVVAALVLGGHAARTGELRLAEIARGAQVGFGIYVLGLGVVVAALGHRWLGTALTRLLPTTPSSASGLGGLLLIALVGAVLANVVNNLPATLLLVPLVAPAGVVALLAMLIGINLGSSLTWTGSLANLLWRRTLQRSGSEASGRDFYALAVLVTPISVLAGVLTLSLWSGIV